jgi:Zn-dependent protease
MTYLLSYPALFLGRVIALVVALSFHEFAHAFAAYRLGDTTAQRAGRLTLNPLAHLDPFGSLMMLLVGFGWAKPVPVNPYNLRGNKLRGMAITAAAGPLSNILQAFVFALPFRFGLLDFEWGSIYWGTLDSGQFLPSPELVLSLLVWINLLLAVFNMIPLGPLDGMKVLLGVLPQQLAFRLEPLAQYGSWLLMALMVLGNGFLLTSMIYPPALNMLEQLISRLW